MDFILPLVGYLLIGIFISSSFFGIIKATDDNWDEDYFLDQTVSIVGVVLIWPLALAGGLFFLFLYGIYEICVWSISKTARIVLGLIAYLKRELI